MRTRHTDGPFLHEREVMRVSFVVLERADLVGHTIVAGAEESRVPFMPGGTITL